jgi:predicted secreted Zn-dependent protease
MFRSDVAPLTAVRIDFPQISEIQYGVDTPALYGCVQKVTITADATRQIANTTFEVSHVRSYIEQKGEIDKNFAGHPLWTLNYTHGRLDERTPTLR